MRFAFEGFLAVDGWHRGSAGAVDDHARSFGDWRAIGGRLRRRIVIVSGVYIITDWLSHASLYVDSSWLP